MVIFHEQYTPITAAPQTAMYKTYSLVICKRMATEPAYV